MLKKGVSSLALVIGLVVTGVCDAKMYEWVDQNGVLHLSNSPPPVSISEDNDNSAESDKSRGEPSNPSILYDTAKSAVIGKIRWITDYNQGLSFARENGHPVMLFFAASWCGSCKSIINTAFSNKRVVQASEKLIPIYVDVDQNRQIMANYKIRGVPTVYFLNHQGQTITKLVGPYETHTYQNAIDKTTAGYTSN